MKQKTDTTAIQVLYILADKFGINWDDILISADKKEWILTINFKDKEEAKNKLPLEDFQSFCEEYNFHGDMIVNEDDTISFRMKTYHNFKTKEIYKMTKFEAYKTVYSTLRSICDNFEVDTDRVIMQPDENAGFIFSVEVPYKTLAKQSWTDQHFQTFCKEYSFTGNIFFLHEEHATLVMTPIEEEESLVLDQKETERVFNSDDLNSNTLPETQQQDVVVMNRDVVLHDMGV